MPVLLPLSPAERAIIAEAVDLSTPLRPPQLAELSALFGVAS